MGINKDKRFVTNMSLCLTACFAGLLLVLAVLFLEFWGDESNGELQKERRQRSPPLPHYRKDSIRPSTFPNLMIVRSCLGVPRKFSLVSMIFVVRSQSGMY